MLEESYVSFEIAELLKEKGFEIPCDFVWYEKCPYSLSHNLVGCKKLDYFYESNTTELELPFLNGQVIPEYISGKVYAAPTHQLARRWLREEKNINIVIECLFDDIDKSTEPYYSAYIVYKTKWGKYDYEEIDGTYNESYEETEEKAMKWVLENLV